ncbi:putative ATP-binding protein involved in virulence [Pseudomonas sp. TE6288]|uniref:AAA family ATPase n=1 Tax=Pseudomonas hunanensis TaxID=1247546 RepID=UPI00240516A0|nr:AAA family ATPase [Pseudomonas hunanensis]MDF9753985.1 putative ATP-binding protein involved in virulence [Pseudomonas hunanensis]
MKLMHVYIQRHKAVADLNVSMGGNADYWVEDHSIAIECRVSTSGYYKGYHCSAIIGANGVGKSSILDFLESVYFTTDSSGVLVFQDKSSKIHVCPINYYVRLRSELFEVHENYLEFAKAHQISLVKINNVSTAQSKFGYEKKFKHSLIQERSLETYAENNVRRKKYFENLLDYLRWSQTGQGVVQDVGFEFKIHDSSHKLSSMIRSDVYEDTIRSELESAYKSYPEKAKLAIPFNTDTVFDYLVKSLSTSIIFELSASSKAKRSIVFAVMQVYFLKALYRNGMDFSLSISHAIEALRYEENWAVFNNSENNKILTSHGAGAVGVDIDRLQVLYMEYLDILKDISNYLAPGIISSEENGSLVVLVDDFSPASKVIHLASRLPRNVLSNINWGWRGISTGEMAYAHLFSETYSCAKKSKNASHIIVIDEADLYLHPEWQRSFLDSYLELLEKLNWGRVKPQLLITTHSPIIVSDFLPQDIVSLVKSDSGRVEVKESLGFGTNITNLFIDGMHLASTVGEHSRKAIVSLVNKSESNELDLLDKELIRGMGNKFVREYLLKDD